MTKALRREEDERDPTGAVPRLAVISTDCHVMPQPRELLGFVSSAYRDDYESFLRRHIDRGEAQTSIRGLAAVATNIESREYGTSQDAIETFALEDAVRKGGLTGLWDSTRRTKELEADGVVAEVLFPHNTPPGIGRGPRCTAAVPIAEVVSAYNRWIADFASDAPGRRAGLALLDPRCALTWNVEEVRLASRRGLRGVFLPLIQDENVVPLYDPVYDDLWAECELLGLPVHFHPISAGHLYGEYGATSAAIAATEAGFFTQRGFWHLLWAGVFERFSELKLVIAEAQAYWVPGKLGQLDHIYRHKQQSDIRLTLSEPPSFYWQRQCFVAASLMTREEALQRRLVGVSNLMWGSDYPHLEGTWPNTVSYLSATFRSLPVDEIRAILADNAASLYGFDTDLLEALAAEHGAVVRSRQLRPGAPEVLDDLVDPVTIGTSS